YNPHAHVSVLPPRTLAGTWQDASSKAQALIEECRPFDVHLTELQVFPVTDVIYLEVGDGAADLRRMHQAMNSGPLAFPEPFAYHPHITLAQEVTHDNVGAMYDLACRRWQEYRGDRSFRAEHAVFVQNTVAD